MSAGWGHIHREIEERKRRSEAVLENRRQAILYKEQQLQERQRSKEIAEQEAMKEKRYLRELREEHRRAAIQKCEMVQKLKVDTIRSKQFEAELRLEHCKRVIVRPQSQANQSANGLRPIDSAML